MFVNQTVAWYMVLYTSIAGHVCVACMVCLCVCMCVHAFPPRVNGMCLAPIAVSTVLEGSLYVLLVMHSPQEGVLCNPTQCPLSNMHTT